MKVLRNFLLVLTVTILWTACSDDDDFPPHKCSFAEFNMSVGGQAYNATLFGTVASDSVESGVGLKMYSINTRDAAGNDVSIIIMDVGNNGSNLCPSKSTYNVVPEAGACVTGDTSAIVCSKVALVSDGFIPAINENTGRGSLTITDCNATDTIMSGTFTFFAQDSLGNDTLSITGGSFNELCFHL